ncbi:DOMON domain containing protein [Klebsormidium nitens]|uniref:DOMON domain containing protein n=1 Tax=Klebsormidium nitens TaxID=105231 RepID=A0A1Y1ICK4_KLENI|nr:DOMON domain containing protein [Klebsormidium nitens]|eukprot:GAQ87169.1 DOMON domain containing protein [Klebsormidium nitens]
MCQVLQIMLLAVLLDTKVVKVAAVCNRSHPLVGFQGPLSSREHGVGGLITIIDDCTFVAQRFNYDGQAPAAYWWAAPGASDTTLTLRRTGFAISEELPRERQRQTTLVQTLPESITWNNIGVLSVWCVDFNANFGSVVLRIPAPDAASSPQVEAVRQAVGLTELPTTGSTLAAPTTNATVSGAPVMNASAACGTSSPFVGYQAQLSTIFHDVAGLLTVIDDCTLVVQNFTFDGSAPATYFWGAPGSSQDPISLRAPRGFRLTDQRLTRSESVTVQVNLKDNLTFAGSGIGVVSVWCEEATANLGSVALQPAAPGAADSAPVAMARLAGKMGLQIGTPRAVPSASVAPAPAPSAGTTLLDGFQNCETLASGRFNLYWTLDNATSSVTYALEGAFAPGSWMGFGFASPNATRVQMVGADVTVASAGTIGGMDGGFAQDYFLTAQVQCNFQSGQSTGVCPDQGLGGGDPSLNNVQLLGYEVDSGVTTVLYRRPLSTSDTRFDHNLTAVQNRIAIFAAGPLSEASTLALPIPLYHENRQGYVNSGLVINLARPGVLNCTRLAGSTAPAPVEAKVPVGVIQGATVLNITTGLNPNYPNPPAWGISLYINGKESPVLVVVRGVEYTFNIMATEEHPVYITDDVTGGTANTLETIYAGGLFSYGNETAPYTFKWTPNATVPSTLYYQCFVHQKLGWKIQVQDTNATVADPSTVAAGSSAAVTAPTNASACPPVPFKSNVLNFATCTTFPGGGQLSWTLSESNFLRAAYSLQHDGWIGFGLSPLGQMVGSSAVVGFRAPNGTALASTYYLSAQTEAGVRPPGRFDVRSVEADFSNGVMVVSFSAQLAPEEAGGYGIVYSRGASGDANTLSLTQHNPGDGRVGSLDFRLGTSSVKGTDQKMRNAHGWINAISWGFLLPLGVLTARYFKAHDPLWFHIHRAVQATGFLLGLSGFFVGVALAERAPGQLTSDAKRHYGVGIAIFASACVQVSSLFYHPEPNTKLRPVWAFLHHWLGRAIITLSIINIYFGLHLLKPKKEYTIAYTVIISGIGAAAVLLETRLQLSNCKGTGEVPRAKKAKDDTEKPPHSDPGAV